MTTEDLLKVRYKVIADSPGLSYKVGELLKPHPKYGFDIFPFPDQYPHLFRPLAWWEERDIKDFPKYVKVSVDDFLSYGQVRKVIEYRLDRLYEVCVTMERQFKDYDREYIFLNDTLPSTEQEYNEYQSKQKLKV